MVGRHGLLPGCLTSPVTSVSPEAERTPLANSPWAIAQIARLVRFEVNKKTGYARSLFGRSSGWTGQTVEQLLRRATREYLEKRAAEAVRRAKSLRSPIFNSTITLPKFDLFCL
jgi:hypothetical protein